ELIDFGDKLHQVGAKYELGLPHARRALIPDSIPDNTRLHPIFYPVSIAASPERRRGSQMAIRYLWVGDWVYGSPSTGQAKHPSNSYGAFRPSSPESACSRALAPRPGTRSERIFAVVVWGGRAPEI